MVNDHSNSGRENPMPPIHGPLFSIISKSYFICTFPHTRLAHTQRPLYTFGTRPMAGTRNSSMGPPRGIDPTNMELHLAPYHCLSVAEQTQICLIVCVTRHKHRCINALNCNCQNHPVPDRRATVA